MSEIPVMTAITAYALLFGTFEILRVPVGPPSARWQVPSGWIRGRRPFVRAAIWGSTLGPGIVTRNPYAGMWLVLPLLALLPNPETGAVAGALVGLAHGLGRALGIVANVRTLDSCSHIMMMGATIRWRLIDGFLSLLTAGVMLTRLVA
jgi:hypothetical protein